MDLTSGLPFWSVRNGLLAVYPRLDGDLTCDVAIIGGGITGALVAYHLAEAGLGAVVMDRREIGWGSTAASTSLLQYEIDVLLTDLSDLVGLSHAQRAYLACRDAIDKLDNLAGKLSDATGFERKKSLYLATKKRDVKALRLELEHRRAIRLRVDWFDEGHIAERFPFERHAALLSHDAAQLDAYAMTHALLKDATRLGLQVFDRTNVASVEATPEGVTLVTAEGCVVRARHVVFATGYETHEFLEQQVACLVSTYALVSEPLPSFTGWGEDCCLIWEHAQPYLYMRTTADGRVMIGGEDEGFKNPTRRDRLLPHKTVRLAKRFREFFPALEMEVAFAWAGTFGETRDGLAYIGEHPQWPSAYFALGYGGNGITYSVLAAEIIRDAILGCPNAYSDLFRFDRQARCVFSPNPAGSRTPSIMAVNVLRMKPSTRSGLLESAYTMRGETRTAAKPACRISG